MTDRLSALDGTFLELEDADHGAHMHIAGLLVLGPRPGGRGVPSLGELRAGLEARLDALPRYRQRLEDGAPGGLTRPRWVDNGRFDIAHHVRRAALPAPGGWEELLEWMGGYLGRRLERSRPLWEIVLVEGLADGHWALATKTHHCMVDGVGAVDVAHLLFDAEPHPAPRPPGRLAPPAPRRTTSCRRGCAAGRTRRCIPAARRRGRCATPRASPTSSCTRSCRARRRRA
jgi:diacylglycerol O-acyltransferase / wax synthase